MGKFFEDLKNDTLEVLNETPEPIKYQSNDISKVGLYVLTFNSPNHFRFCKYLTKFLTLLFYGCKPDMFQLH